MVSTTKVNIPATFTTVQRDADLTSVPTGSNGFNATTNRMNITYDGGPTWVTLVSQQNAYDGGNIINLDPLVDDTPLLINKPADYDGLMLQVYNTDGDDLRNLWSLDHTTQRMATTYDIISEGSFGFRGTIGTPGAGSRFLFNGRTGAVRAGVVDGTQWDVSNVGLYSVAMGQNLTASGLNSAAFGKGLTVVGIGSFGINATLVAKTFSSDGTFGLYASKSFIESLEHRVGDDTDKTITTPTGSVMSGAHRVKNLFTYTPNRKSAGANAPASLTLDTFNHVLQFKGNKNEEFFITFTPDLDIDTSVALEITVVWQTSSTNTGTVDWKLDYASGTPETSTPITATPATISITDSATGTNKDLLRSSITTLATPAIGDVFKGRFYRDAGTDTYADDAHFHLLEINAVRNKMGGAL